ncbi:MAG TPA: hypothetical protein VJ201_08340 [Candidatus Babeliales bacterium]|nr:hypothetical protein [Candidatus Babeliales bacterium]
MIERKTSYKKPVVIGIATYAGREESLKQVLISLSKQCDQIVLYDNEVNPNLTDLGKFYGLYDLKESVYYLCCDDDIVYGDTYVKDMVSAIERTGTIVSHHGRQLLGLGRSYYRGHKSFRCLGSVLKEEVIDVAGTGVAGFDTEYFNPIDLIYSKDMKMSDLVFSLEAAKQNKTITILRHNAGYLKSLPQDEKKSIWFEHRKNHSRQNEIADEIYLLTNKKTKP